MSMFKIRNIQNNSTIEILATNIDNDHSILAIEGGQPLIISLKDFKEMVLGTHPSDGPIMEPTYEIVTNETT